MRRLGACGRRAGGLVTFLATLALAGCTAATAGTDAGLDPGTDARLDADVASIDAADVSPYASDDRGSATDPGDLRARWTGLRASGEWRADSGSRLAYWADAARLSGREVTTAFAEQSDGTFTAAAAQSRRVSGRAHDVGVTATLGVPLRPSLTLAHARGSEGFRQTGLQENKARIGGVKRWQRYGELLQPELSNLAVTSAGVGVRLTDNTSLELVGHRFRQLRAAGSLPGARVSPDPQGTSRDVGREVNLLLAVRESRHVEFTVKASQFKPGAAFAPDRRGTARAVEFGVAVNF